MFALLQINPPEALDDTDCGVDVLAVDVSEERLEQFAADYQERFRAAHQEWQQWDDISREWDAMDDCRLDELEHKYCVSSPTFGDMRWQIVEVWAPAFGPGVVRAVA